MSLSVIEIHLVCFIETKGKLQNIEAYSNTMIAQGRPSMQAFGLILTEDLFIIHTDICSLFLICYWGKDERESLQPLLVFLLPLYYHHHSRNYLLVRMDELLGLFFGFNKNSLGNERTISEYIRRYWFLNNPEKMRALLKGEGFQGGRQKTCLMIGSQYGVVVKA